MSEYKQGCHPNTIAARKPFKSGKDWNGKGGGPSAGMTLKMWWSTLAAENEFGIPKYTLQMLKEISGADDDDANVSITKRVAAQNWIDMAKGGRDGRDMLSLLFDRTEGRPNQSVALTGSLTANPAAEITNETLARIREASSMPVNLLETDIDPE